jgi:WD40 repeat protein
VSFWEVSTGKALRTLDLGEAAVGSLSFSPDGKALAGAGTGSLVRLWDTTTGDELHKCEGHRGEIRSVGFSADGRLVATAGADSTVRLWDPATGREIRVCHGTRLYFDRVLFSPDGNALFACTGNPNHPVLEWDVATGALRRSLDVPLDEPRRLTQVRTIALSPEGTTLSAVSWTGSGREQQELLVAWDLRTGKSRVESLAPLPGAGWSRQLSPDARLLARLEGPSVHVRDATAGKELLTLRAPCDAVTNVAFSPDSRILAAGCLRREADGVSIEGRQERSLVVWELATGKELRRMELGAPFASYGFPIGFSPDGRILAAGGDDPEAPVRLWDLATGKELVRLTGQQGSVTCLAFSPEGAKLAGGLRSGVALVWDVRPARAVTFGGPRLRAAQRLTEQWADLGGSNPAKAQAALWELTASPEAAVELLRDRVKPVAAVEPQELGRLVADLDSDSFALRDKAAKELDELGTQAEAVLRRALQETASAETRRRVAALLTSPGLVRSPETLRSLRAIQVLEAIGSKEARNVLKALAEGASEARQTREARDSLRRLTARQPQAP